MSVANSTFDISQANPVLKARYTDKAVQKLGYPKMPVLAMIPKDTKLSGKSWNWAVRTAPVQTVSTLFANAVASNANAGTTTTYSNFVALPSHYNHFGTANITGDAIDTAKGDAAALIDVLTNEIDNTIYQMQRELQRFIIGNGGSAAAAVGSGQGTTTVTLADITNITRFDVGMPIQVGVDDGSVNPFGGLRASGAVAFVKAVDRDLGTIQVSATVGGAAAVWTSIFTSSIAGDSIFRAGDYPTVNGTLTSSPGFLGYLPKTAPAPGSSFLGLDRSVDAVRLAGVRFSGGGQPYEESLISCAARLGREEASPDTVFMNPLDIDPLVRALGSRVVYDRAVKSYDNPDIGFKVVTVVGPNGDMNVIGCEQIPSGTFFMLTLSSWCLRSMGRAPRQIENDGNMLLRVAGADAYEARFVSRYLVTCDAPGWNAVGTF